MTYGPGPADARSGRPPRAHVGLLVGLVVVLLLICGGIAVTAWRFAGTDSAARAAGGNPVWQPEVGTSTPAVPSSPSDPAAPSAPDPPSTPATPVPASSAVVAPPAGRSVVPAQGSLVPFGDSHAAAWPDQLRAVVPGADRRDLPEDLATKYPGDVEVYVWINIDNYTPDELTIAQAQVHLWYGPNHTPAVQFEDPSDVFEGVSGTIKPDGSRLWGDATFVVPPQYLTQLVVEIRPRPGDAPARFFGAAK